MKVLPLIFNIDIPFELVSELEKCKTDQDAFQVGVEWATQQSKELIQFGVPVIHYFTIGKSDSIKQIAKAVL